MPLAIILLLMVLTSHAQKHGLKFKPTSQKQGILRTQLLSVKLLIYIESRLPTLIDALVAATYEL